MLPTYQHHQTIDLMSWLSHYPLHLPVMIHVKNKDNHPCCRKRENFFFNVRHKLVHETWKSNERNERIMVVDLCTFAVLKIIFSQSGRTLIDFGSSSKVIFRNSTVALFFWSLLTRNAAQPAPSSSKI